jgi:arabinan endo-1,5-alpha-L-arabinosidase
MSEDSIRRAIREESDAKMVCSQHTSGVQFMRHTSGIFMKCILLALVLGFTPTIYALDGDIGIHDPSTVVMDHGKYYTYGTGGGSLVSDDGWTWRRGVTPPLTGAAPDVIHIGQRFYLYVARGSGGRALPNKAEIDMIWSKSLDPDSPDYKWHQGGKVASSNGLEDCNAIDPGAFLDPTTGRLWLTYGSYVGYIRLVELDPKTGMDLHPDEKPIDLAINGEASDMFYHDGWYYLLDTHGSCCAGSNSGYNIRVGRSRKVTGPFVDGMGIDMIEGGGTMLIGSGGRFIGPGHFGLLNLGDGLQMFSMHWEADLDQGGASVLDIRPLLWKDGWPVAGENVKPGMYDIQSPRTGTSLDMEVEGMPVGGPRRFRGFPPPQTGATRTGEAARPGANGRPAEGARPGGQGPGGLGGPGRPGGGFPGGMFGGTGKPIPDQDAAQVDKDWPAGNVDAGMSNYMCQAQQKWQITPVPDAGGHPGSPYFKITIAGTDRTLAAAADAELVVLPAFTDAPEQLWRFDQLADGTWRIEPKAIPNSNEPMALSAVGASFATLEKFDPKSDRQHWLLKTP